MQAAKALASLHICANMAELSLLAYAISSEILCTGPKCFLSLCVSLLFNPFKVNGFSQLYQLEEFTSYLGLLGGISHFHSNFNRTFCRQTMENLIRRRVFCTVCRCPTKRTLSLYGLNLLACIN